MTSTPRRRAPLPTSVLATLAALYYLAAVALGVVVVTEAEQATRAHRALVTYDSAEEKTDTLVRGLLESVSLGMYRGASEKSARIEEIASEATRAAGRSRDAAFGLLALSAVFVAVLWGRRRARRSAPPGELVAHLLGVSAVFLAVGLVAPILTVSAHKDIAVLGRVMLQHDTKSIIGTVTTLWAAGSAFLAGILALFSIAAPSLKLVLSLGALAVPHAGARRLSLGTVELIGRWSMTDVFVVSILVAYLATDTDRLTDAAVGIGLYFFAGYALLSLAAGQLMVRHRAALVERVPTTG
ncbi:MAG: paraquat-inducible protein A [Ectothiorhodospiraceae bacterium]|nr:paraquat-inducible protein A [Chromatiales bacterium]MCP5157563.1 paraquat-inducible protein A [Ectothiorhodospiraceae bacterium]